MNRTQALEALIAAIVAGDDAEVSSLLRMMASKARDNGTIWPSHDAAKAFNGSLDAAKALHEAVLPGRSCGVTFGWEYGATVTLPPTWDCCHITESNQTPARAWLLAILRALLAQEASA